MRKKSNPLREYIAGDTNGTLTLRLGDNPGVLSNLNKLDSLGLLDDGVIGTLLAKQTIDPAHVISTFGHAKVIKALGLNKDFRLFEDTVAVELDSADAVPPVCIFISIVENFVYFKHRAKATGEKLLNLEWKYVQYKTLDPSEFVPVITAASPTHRVDKFISIMRNNIEKGLSIVAKMEGQTKYDGN